MGGETHSSHFSAGSYGWEAGPLLLRNNATAARNWPVSHFPLTGDVGHDYIILMRVTDSKITAVNTQHLGKRKTQALCPNVLPF